MSYVTGVVLTLGVQDETQLPVINRWIRDHKYVNGLFPLDDECGGSKHPQFRLAAGGFNYFPEDDFLQFLGTLRVAQPENFVALLQPEEGQTRVWRGDTLAGILK